MSEYGVIRPLFSLILAAALVGLVLLPAAASEPDPGDVVLDSGQVAGAGADLPAVLDPSTVLFDAEGNPVDLSGFSVDAVTIDAGSVLLSADEPDPFPSGSALQSGVYMQMTSSEFGEMVVWIPTNYQYRSFGLNEDGVPINITASTINGYYYASQDYVIRWASFEQPQYRLSSSGSYDWSQLTVTSVGESNVDWSQDQYVIKPDTDTLLLMILFMMGAVAIWIFTR